MHIHMRGTKTNNNMTNLSKFFGIFFLLTGIFSLISSLVAWGQGWLFSIKNYSPKLPSIYSLRLPTTNSPKLITTYLLFCILKIILYNELKN